MTTKKNAMELRRRGPPVRARSARERDAIWYWRIRARGFRDNRLDLMFGSQDSSVPVCSIDKDHTFERTRKRWSVPGRSQEEKNAFVRRVDACHGLHGTAEIYFSEYWELMQPWEVPHREASRLLDSCLPRLGLQRLSYSASLIYLRALRDSDKITIDRDFKINEFQKVMLRQFVKKCPVGLDLLTVIGILYKESYLSQELDLALIYKAEFLKLLKKVMAKFMSELAAKFADDPAAQKSVAEVIRQFGISARIRLLHGRISRYNMWDLAGALMGYRRFRLIVRRDDTLAKYAVATEKKSKESYMSLYKTVFSIKG